MLARYSSVIIAVLLLVLVATACIVRSSRPPGQRSQPVYVEKHKDVKHKKVKHKKHKQKKHK